MLAGDHLKAASDLGLPLVGIGLFYREGYFRQSLTADGWQQERYPELDPRAMALVPGDGIRVSIDLPGSPRGPGVEAEVGRVPLYLLDTNIPENTPEQRVITDRLYGGDNDIACARRSCSGSAASAPWTRSASTPRCST